MLRLPTPHLPRPYAIQAAPLAPECGRTFLFEVSPQYKPWCLWKVKNRSSRLEHKLIDVTPDPVLSRLEGLNDRMVGRVEMPGCVLVLYACVRLVPALILPPRDAGDNLLWSEPLNIGTYDSSDIRICVYTYVLSLTWGRCYITRQVLTSLSVKDTITWYSLTW